MDRDQLLKDYARIIDEQKEEIEKLHVIAEKWGWLNTKYIIQMQNLEGKWVNLEEHSTKKLATSAMPYYGKDFSLRIIERKYNDWVVKDI